MTYRTQDLDDVVRDLAGAGVDAEVRDGKLLVYGWGEIWVRERGWPVLLRWREMLEGRVVKQVGPRC